MKTRLVHPTLHLRICKRAETVLAQALQRLIVAEAFCVFPTFFFKVNLFSGVYLVSIKACVGEKSTSL